MFKNTMVGDLIRAYTERIDHIEKIGFVKLIPKLGHWIASWGPWVEVAAGSDRLARLIREQGGRCVATDNFSWHKEKHVAWGRENVIRGDAVRVARLVSRYPRIGLLMSWPEYNEEWAYAAARLLQPGQRLCYIGEGAVGCTADNAFHELLESDFELLGTMSVDPWPSIHDCCFVYRRRVPNDPSRF